MNSNSSDTEFIDVLQLSKILSVKRKTIYDWVLKEKIPYYKLGGLLRFSLDEIQQWIESKRNKQ